MWRRGWQWHSHFVRGVCGLGHAVASLQSVVEELVHGQVGVRGSSCRSNFKSFKRTVPVILNVWPVCSNLPRCYIVTNLCAGHAGLLKISQQIIKVLRFSTFQSLVETKSLPFINHQTYNLLCKASVWCDAGVKKVWSRKVNFHVVVEKTETSGWKKDRKNVLAALKYDHLLRGKMWRRDVKYILFVDITLNKISGKVP